MLDTIDPFKESVLAKSYEQIHAQIQKLQAQAEALKSKEMEQVISRIRTAIAHYELTPEHLFGTPTRTNRRTATKKAAARKSAVAGKKAAIKFRDGDNTWSGRGNRPRWLVARLAEGRDIAEFKID